MKHARFVWILAAALVAVPAFADQIVHFKNGQAMAVEGHAVKGDMIEVHLGGNDRLTFPLSSIEKIEESGRDVLGQPGGSKPANVMQPAQVVPRSKINRPKRNEPVMDKNISQEKGVLIERPFSGASGARAKLGLTGTQGVRDYRSRMFQRDQYGGTTNRGTAGPKTLPSRASRQLDRKARLKSFTQRTNGETKPVQKKPAGNDNGSSGSSDN